MEFPEQYNPLDPSDMDGEPMDATDYSAKRQKTETPQYETPQSSYQFQRRDILTSAQKKNERMKYKRTKPRLQPGPDVINTFTVQDLMSFKNPRKKKRIKAYKSPIPITKTGKSRASDDFKFDPNDENKVYILKNGSKARYEEQTDGTYRFRLISGADKDFLNDIREAWLDNHAEYRYDKQKNVWNENPNLRDPDIVEENVALAKWRFKQDARRKRKLAKELDKKYGTTSRLKAVNAAITTDLRYSNSPKRVRIGALAYGRNPRGSEMLNVDYGGPIRNWTQNQQQARAAFKRDMETTGLRKQRQLQYAQLDPERKRAYRIDNFPADLKNRPYSSQTRFLDRYRKGQSWDQVFDKYNKERDAKYQKQQKQKMDNNGRARAKHPFALSKSQQTPTPMMDVGDINGYE